MQISLFGQVSNRSEIRKVIFKVHFEIVHDNSQKFTKTMLVAGQVYLTCDSLEG